MREVVLDKLRRDEFVSDLMVLCRIPVVDVAERSKTLSCVPGRNDSAPE